MSKAIVTGIDVGTANIRVVVAEYDSSKKGPAIIAATQRESRGLRHGYIINPEETSLCIREAMKEAERLAKVKLRSAYVSVGGISVSSSIAEGSIAVSRADSEISDADVKRVLAASEANLKDAINRRVLHLVPLYFRLDGKRIPGRPTGFKGSVLEVRSLFITCLNQHVDDLIAAVENAGIEVDDVFAAPIAESAATLARIQRNSGCVLANIGAETVSTIVYEEGIPLSLQVFPIGSTDITNDIALGMKVSLEEAEELKRHRPEGTTRRKFDEIIEARLTDIFELIEAHLKKIGKNGLLPAGIIMSGGGAMLESIEELAKNSLRLPAHVASVHEIRDPSWTVAYGLSLTGGNPDPEESMGVKIAKRTTSGFIYWLKQFLP